MDRQAIYRYFNNQAYKLLKITRKYHPNILIQGLMIIKFNLQLRNRLKSIYQKYKSKEFLEEMIAQLYEKEIMIMMAQ